MVKYTESQNKIVATGHAVVSFALVLLFIATIAWCILKALSFAAPAVIPVATGFFLALFFKPYYHWWEKKIHIRSLALIIMLITVLAPVTIVIWWAGSAIVNEIVNFFRQMPDMFGHLFGWLDSTFPKLKDVLGSLQQMCEIIGGFSMMNSVDAISSGTSTVNVGLDNVTLVCANTGTSATNTVINVLGANADIMGVCSNGCDAALQTAKCAFQGVSNTVGGVAVACDVPMVHSITTGVNVAGMNISYDKLLELYNNYGDSIKKAGMNLYQAGVANVGATGSASEASLVTPVATSGTGVLGASYGKLAAAFANCKGALLFAGAGILGFMRTLLYVLVTALFFVFFLMSEKLRGGVVAEYIPALKDKTRKCVAKQIDALIEILVGFFQRQVAICLIEGCYYGIGFWLVGIPYGFFIGLTLGILNLIPFFGSIVCMPLALTVAYFGVGGSGLRVVLAIIVWTVGLALDGYFITPKIQGDKTGLGYAGVIFSFILWPMLLGPMLGMLLAIPLSACCVVIWRSICELTKTAKVL